MPAFDIVYMVARDGHVCTNTKNKVGGNKLDKNQDTKTATTYPKHLLPMQHEFQNYNTVRVFF